MFQSLSLLFHFIVRRKSGAIRTFHFWHHSRYDLIPIPSLSRFDFRVQYKDLDPRQSIRVTTEHVFPNPSSIPLHLRSRARSPSRSLSRLVGAFTRCSIIAYVDPISSTSLSLPTAINCDKLLFFRSSLSTYSILRIFTLPYGQVPVDESRRDQRRTIHALPCLCATDR